MERGKELGTLTEEEAFEQGFGPVYRVLRELYSISAQEGNDPTEVIKWAIYDLAQVLEMYEANDLVDFEDEGLQDLLGLG